MHEQNIVIFVNQLDSLVYLAVLVDLDQTAETPHAVIDMHHIIAHAELIQLCDGHLFVALDLAVDPIALVAVENLMVGIETKFQVVIDETLVQRDRQRVDLRLLTSRLVENVLQPFELRPVFRQDISFITALSVGNDVVGQQFEILVELGLGSRAERDRRIGRRSFRLSRNSNKRIPAMSCNNTFRLTRWLSISAGSSISPRTLRRRSFTRRST